MNFWEPGEQDRWVFQAIAIFIAIVTVIGLSLLIVYVLRMPVQ